MGTSTEQRNVSLLLPQSSLLLRVSPWQTEEPEVVKAEMQLAEPPAWHPRTAWEVNLELIEKGLLADSEG